MFDCPERHKAKKVRRNPPIMLFGSLNIGPLGLGGVGILGDHKQRRRSMVPRYQTALPSLILDCSQVSEVENEFVRQQSER